MAPAVTGRGNANVGSDDDILVWSAYMPWKRVIPSFIVLTQNGTDGTSHVDSGAIIGFYLDGAARRAWQMGRRNEAV